MENVTVAFQEIQRQRKENILKSFGYENSESDLEKARSGTYADTPENRKLGRVGRQYGGKKQQEDSKGEGKKDRSSSNSDSIDKIVAKEARQSKDAWVKNVREYGGDRGTEDFMSKNEKHFKPVLDKLGYESYDDFMNDWDDDEKFSKNWDKMVKMVPAEEFLPDGKEAARRKAEVYNKLSSDKQDEMRKYDTMKRMIQYPGKNYSVIDSLRDSVQEFEKRNKSMLDYIKTGKGKYEVDESVKKANPFESLYGAEPSDDVEKSDIYEAIGYSEQFKFEKTGKEIKQQISSVVLPEKLAMIEQKKAEADALLEECGDLPTCPINHWRVKEFNLEIGYNLYEWCETRCSKGSVTDCCGENIINNPPATEEEAKNRCKYNEAVNAIIECSIDVYACNLLLNNLKDSEKIKLNPRQLIVFRFS